MEPEFNTAYSMNYRFIFNKVDCSWVRFLSIVKKRNPTTR